MKLQGGGVLVPGTVFLGLALAGGLVEERYRVNIRKDRHRHAADSREVNAPRQMSAVNPADSLYSGKYLSRCFHCCNGREDKTDLYDFGGLRSGLFL